MWGDRLSGVGLRDVLLLCGVQRRSPHEPRHRERERERGDDDFDHLDRVEDRRDRAQPCERRVDAARERVGRGGGDGLIVVVVVTAAAAVAALEDGARGELDEQRARGGAAAVVRQAARRAEHAAER